MEIAAESNNNLLTVILERHPLQADCGDCAPTVSQDHEQPAPVTARIVVIDKWRWPRLQFGPTHLATLCKASKCSGLYSIIRTAGFPVSAFDCSGTRARRLGTVVGNSLRQN